MATASLLQGSDNFFAGEPNLVATFDIDYDLVIDFKTKVNWVGVGLCCPITSLCCGPCFVRKNVEWGTYSQHVAITQDGIKFVVDKRPTACGLACTDKGKVSKTVPFDKITDCDIEEPAGTACCCCIQNVLTRVVVDTASSGQKTEGGVVHELTLEGLKEPAAFKKMVWDMKSGRHSAAAAPQPSSTGVQQPPPQQDMNAALLEKIYNELRTLNTNLAKR